MNQESLAARITRQLETQHGLRVTVAETNGAILLSGQVPSERDRQQAAQLAARMSSGLRIQNLLDVERTLPADRAEGEPENTIAESVNPEFTGQPLETNTLAVEGASVGDQRPVEPDPVFFPPTDPVTTSDQEGNLEVLGGFEPTAMSDESVARSAEDNIPGDEALADAITRELREDALTTALTIDVAVERGVAHLRGQVPDLEDAENAEAVASRIPGVREVVEELDVAQI